ncbi:MAG TPA: DMT family transporter [Thermodesulfobacteriota bacterium]|nr:DMT family transporter [Thermodesulfobacteriota bacterium]
MDKSDSKISHLFLVGVVFLWGANIGIVKSAFQDIHPVLFAALRFTISGVLMLLFVLWREKDLRIRSQDWRLIFMVGGLGIGIYQIFWSLGLQWTTATNSALIFTIQPLLGAVYVDLTKKEPVSKQRYLGMLLALGGVILVILKPTLQFRFSTETVWGDLLTLMAAVCSAIFFTVWPKPLLRVYSPVRLMGYCMLIGSIILWVAVPFSGKLMPFDQIGEKAWWPLIYAIVFAGMLGHTFWYEGVGRIGATKTLIYLYFIPIWAAVFNYFYMGERIFIQQVLGGGLILVGVHYALRD